MRAEHGREEYDPESVYTWDKPEGHLNQWRGYERNPIEEHFLKSLIVLYLFLIQGSQKD